jgi:hypothetical protein
MDWLVPNDVVLRGRSVGVASLQDSADGRRPPSGAAVRCRDPVGVEARGDLAEGPTSGALLADALRDFRRNARFASPRRWLKSRSCYPSPLDGQPLEFIDRDQLGAPWQLDRVDVRQQAT